MNDFKDCYQSAVKDLGILGMKEFHMALLNAWMRDGITAGWCGG